MAEAIKSFEFSEGSTEDMWYKITVTFRGKMVEVFLRPTMLEAQRAFRDAGYVKVG